VTVIILAYLAALWWTRRETAIADALFVNWAVNQAAVLIYVDNGSHMLVFITTDFLTGLWLTLKMQGKAARRAALFFLPMIALNAGAYAAGGNPPRWQEITLDALAWAQLLWVVLETWGHGLLAIFDNSGGGFRHSISRASGFFRNEK